MLDNDKKIFDTEEQEEIQSECPDGGMPLVADENNEDAEQLKQEIATLNDKYVRLSAEFDNYRKRTLKEKADILKSAGEDLLVRLLPVVDNFERALDSMEKTKDVESIYEGVMLIYAGFKDFLTQNGVKEVDCSAGEFNIDEQEAVTKIPVTSGEQKGKVVDCIQKGYTLNGKVIRFAKVVIGE